MVVVVGGGGSAGGGMGAGAAGAADPGCRRPPRRACPLVSGPFPWPSWLLFVGRAGVNAGHFSTRQILPV